MDNKALIFLIILAAAIVILIVLDKSMTADKLKSFGEIKAERDLYKALSQNYYDRYWELHKLHYEDEEKD